MAEQSGASESPRRRRTGSARSTSAARSTRSTARRTSSRAKAATPEIVDQLHGMVDELIKENRKLKRQVERLASKGSAAATGAVERGLRTLQRRVERALGGGQPARRRRSTASASRTRKAPSSTTRRRRSGGASASS